MILFSNLLDAFFIKRLNRFAALISMGNSEYVCHVPNSGRMKELLWEGCPIRIKRAENENRKTLYDLILVLSKNVWVNINSQLPNDLVYQGIHNKIFQPFMNAIEIKREIRFGSSRFDIGLIANNQPWLIENKCVTYVDKGCAMFPDAPTERGTKHMTELVHAKQMGFEGAVFFIIQRPDAKVFRPHEVMDKKFANALREAQKGGVSIFAYNCHVTDHSTSIKDSIAVEL